MKPQKREGTSKMRIAALLVLGIAIGAAGYWFISAMQPPDRSGQGLPPQLQQQGTHYRAQDLPAYVHQYDGQPPARDASGEPIHLVNHDKATDVTFGELKSFVLQDDTNEYEYIEGKRTCGDFAEMLHNNAEKAGIRAAFVGINFVRSEIGHAINVFPTTDEGLVYVDCTGPAAEDFSHKDQYDMIGYIERFEEYGTIPLNKARNLHYTFYREYGQNMRRSPFIPMEPVDTVDIFW